MRYMNPKQPKEEELTGRDREIKDIEDELARTKYNKATESHIGRLKAKIAKLKIENERKAKGGKHGLGYAVKKQGDATAVLVGFPSTGKSTLLNRLSNADSKTAAYDFTTLTVVPGIMEINGAKIQMLDIPGFIEGASEGRGRGKEVLSVLRAADLILIILDAGKDYARQLDIIQRELYEAGFRLNQKPPEVVIQKKNTGGTRVGSAIRLTKLDMKTIKDVLQEFRFLNVDVIIREDLDIDRLIDAFARNRRYVPSLVLLNKIDLAGAQPGVKADVAISSLRGTNLDRLKELIWQRLCFMRVYLKRIGREPDMKEPLIMKSGSTVNDVCLRIHKEFARNFKFARIWGSGKFAGQRKGGDYVLADGDVVELHL
jgi:small GTP-binding protein